LNVKFATRILKIEKKYENHISSMSHIEALEMIEQKVKENDENEQRRMDNEKKKLK